MFTGRVDEIGQIEQIEAGRLMVRAPRSAAALTAGGSVCVAGVRLTVQEAGPGTFGAAITRETRCRSTFDALTEGSAVNVEVPLAAGDALDGHLVQGYVDAVGKIVRVDAEGASWRVWIRPPERLRGQLAAKSAIAVDGVSMTVADVLKDRFSIVLLPVTRTATTLACLSAGGRVNLELDLVSRLVARRASGASAVPGQVTAALSQVTAALPRAGHLAGRHGVAVAVRHFTAGGAVLVWDPEIEGEADVILPGARLKPESFTFLLTQVCGYPCVPCATAVLERLEIEALPGEGDRQHTAFCMPVDRAAGQGTGVSAAERAATVRRLADPAARPGDFSRPGHVIPLAARPGLLAERVGHTEATVALCVAAGLPPVGVCCELMNPDGTMAGAADAEIFALRWGLPLVELGDLQCWL
jgi:3,4-dihydroxy 2-butanone 4-phosphate synthase/3,4-dihydroxy 2-butanone 4-phosphate synthase/GTP cyclohydrolase II